MWRPLSLVAFVMVTAAACDPGGLQTDDTGVFAPGVAGESNLDGLIVGHRLMDAGEYELALQAYNRAAVQQGINVDTLSAIGSANLRLGRLGQAERWLRRAVDEDPTFAPAWNNLGVILMERGRIGEASQVFRRAFAADNGNSDEIRENLRLALAKLENIDNNASQQNQSFSLIRRGASDNAPMLEP